VEIAECSVPVFPDEKVSPAKKPDKTGLLTGKIE